MLCLQMYTEWQALSSGLITVISDVQSMPVSGDLNVVTPGVESMVVSGDLNTVTSG